ncbi:hypothetical protein A3Q56_08262, partial [Intoshia linei]
ICGAVNTDGIRIMKYYDKREVLMISTFHGMNYDLIKRKWRNGKEISKPCLNKILKLQKGTPIFALNSYLFTIKREKNDCIHWRCKVRSCRSHALTNINLDCLNDSFLKEITDPLEISKLKNKNDMKRKSIKAVTESPLSIVTDIMSGDPKSIAHPDFAIYEKLKISKRKEQFYRYGPGNYCSLPIYENIAMFFTNSMISILHNEKVCSIDGTFYVIHKPHYQLYNISIIKNHHVVPVMYCLLKNK